MDKGSGAVRRVPFWRSLQTKFALTYIVIVAAVLILLNTYPLVVSEKLAYQSKQASMLNQASVLASALAPGPEAQRQIMSLIYDDIKAGKLGDPEKFAAAHQDLIAQGCDCAILACTELSVFATQHPLSTFFIDAMAVLAERAVQACRKPLRQIHSK